MLNSPFSTRIISGVILVICATVVLGISAHVENASRSLGLSTATYTYDAFVGAFTILAELVLFTCRLIRRETFLSTVAGELGVAAVLWVFWLAAAISTTVLTTEGRSFCRHLNDLFDVPELKNLDPAEIAAAKKILQSACSEIHAELAFLWIGFIVLTAIIGYLTVLGIRGGRSHWKVSLKKAGHPVDPFADPSGNVSGRTVGVVENPDIKP